MSETAPAPVAAPEAPAEPTPTSEATPEAKSAPEGSQGPSGAIPEAGSGPGSAAKRLFKITVGGETRELPEEEVVARAQKSEFHEKRSQELARRQAQIDKAMAGAKQDPEAAFNDLARILGLDAKQIAQQKLAAELRVQIEQDELNAMDPASRQAHQDRQELARLRKAEQDRLEKVKQDEAAAAQSKAQTHMEGVLDKAMEYGLKGTKLEGDPFAQYQFAQLVAITAQDVMDGKLAEMPNPKQLAAHLERELGRLSGRYAPPAPPAPPAKPAHPASNRPAREDRPRHPATGQFIGPHQAKDFSYAGKDIFEKLAKNSDKAAATAVKRFLHGRKTTSS